MESPPIFAPAAAAEIPDFLRARAEGTALRIRGCGSKAAFGRPAASEDAILDLSALSGITLYEPDELVLSAHAGTPLADIAAAVTERGQCLAFEPPELNALLGGGEGGPTLGGPTLGGIVACGWSGPRRIKAGAVRDHVLGIQAIGGDGQSFRSGGRVVKNVTGFDLPKLLTGSHGTLAVMTDITIKVLPAPQRTRTLVLFGLDDAEAVALMTAALGGPFEIAGAAHLPAKAAARSSSADLARSGGSATLLRLEGFGPSVDDRFAALEQRFAKAGDFMGLDSNDCITAWREVREVAGHVDSGAVVWRLSLRATDAARVTADILAKTGGEAFYDWGGGLVWLALPSGGPDGHAATVREALPSGHATLMRAPADMRVGVPVFQPRPPALAALEDRVKTAFDPRAILAPRFMSS
ncbi:MAG TPA: FAD-binding protein [Alphaproteobacteria bacterium]|jgi:glycolate oxidase FAD binding subunit|nr:FAD-binding protein [Alphaproteobacteria bacterium]